MNQAGARLRQTCQSLAPVGLLGEEALLHSLLLSLHLLQETLLLLLQGVTCCVDLSQDLLPRTARRDLRQGTRRDIRQLVDQWKKRHGVELTCIIKILCDSSQKVVVFKFINTLIVYDQIFFESRNNTFFQLTV